MGGNNTTALKETRIRYPGTQLALKMYTPPD